MARIIIALTPDNIGTILSHGEVGLAAPELNNLSEVVIKCHQYDVFPTLEVKKDD